MTLAQCVSSKPQSPHLKKQGDRMGAHLISGGCTEATAGKGMRKCLVAWPTCAGARPPSRNRGSRATAPGSRGPASRQWSGCPPTPRPGPHPFVTTACWCAQFPLSPSHSTASCWGERNVLERLPEGWSPLSHEEGAKVPPSSALPLPGTWIQLSFTFFYFL